MGSETASPLIVIVGETASGKSGLALEVAERFGGEIICADSWTVRREVNIGTAKPSADDRARIPHHLLDVVAPCADFTAAVFKDMANQAITDISERNKVPVMVGGTGLYVDGVIFDYGFLPEAGKDRRKELDALSIEQLIRQCKREGLSLEGIDTRNKRRLVRLLETGGARPTRQKLRPNTLILGMSMTRAVLKEHITTRVDYMLQQGLEQEVERLAQTYGWECEALKGIGYREWGEYFSGQYDIQQTKSRIVKSTIELAKRQRTWFKRNKSIHWLDNPSNAVDIITTFLSKTII